MKTDMRYRTDRSFKKDGAAAGPACSTVSGCKMRMRIRALLLAGIVVFSSAGTAYAEENDPSSATDASSYYSEKEHADMDYADMEYVSVDPHAMDEVLAKLDAVTDGTGAEEDPEQQTVELYHEILQIMDSEYTHYVLGDIKHYMNVHDEDMNEKNRQDTLNIQDMSDAVLISLQKALTGPYGSELRKEFSDEQADELEEYEALTDRERELIDKDTELQQKYDHLSEEEYTFEYKGKTWTLDDLYTDQPEDYDDLMAVYLGVSKAANDALVPVYQEMIETRKELAELEGYDTYTDYCYDVDYGRDFTGEDIAALRETVIREIKPLYEELRMMQYMSDFNTELEQPLTGGEIVETIGEHIGNVQPELTEAFEYMREHGLYCIDNTDEMLDVGFTSDLPEYGSAFIFDKTNGTVHDLETLVHEFGHFNAAYHAKQNTLMDSLLVDVAEIHSQGLEMLFLDEMKEILTDDPDALQLYMLTNMLESVLSGFEYDEFQQKVYAGEEMTQEELNELAMDVDEKYTGYFYEDDGEAYEWVLINHTFTAPLYYIGYATSALSALDIWTESLEDRDAAVDKYMKLSAVPLDMPYQEATTSCGLRNMLDPENISELADEIRGWAEENLSGGFDELGFPDFGSPFGFGEEDPFGFGEGNPFGFGEESPFDFSQPAPAEPYWVEPTPDGSGMHPDDSARPDDSSEQPNDNSEQSDDNSLEYLEAAGRQTMRAAWITTVVRGLIKIGILIIALIVFFKKKKRNRGGDNFSGQGGWNGRYDQNGQYGQYGPEPDGWNGQYGPYGQNPNGWNGQYGQYGQYGPGPDGWNGQYDPYGQNPDGWNGQYGQYDQRPDEWNGQYSQNPDGWNGQYGQNPEGWNGQYSQNPDSWNGQYGQNPEGRDGQQQQDNSREEGTDSSENRR